MTAALSGGCSSPVRSGRAVGGPPFLQSRGEGAYAFDDSGRRYIDYIMAYGPLLFGHTHPALTRGLDVLAARGFVYGSTHAEEERLARRISGIMPAMESIRFVTTGTEAVMSALRVARAYTQRSAVLKFAGNYHGHFDLALLQAGASARTSDPAGAGIPSSACVDVLIARYNDLSSVDALLEERAADLAAIVVEPIAANMGYVAPQAGFLAGLAQRARDCGALLVYDEVVTGLRLGRGGAQAWCGVAPDLTTIGKVLGGGVAIAAFGGRRPVMGVLAPSGPTFCGGTHAGNPFSVGMAHRVLDLLEEHPEYYEHLNTLGERLARGLREVLAHRRLPYAVVQHGSIVDFKFRQGGAAQNYDDIESCDPKRYAAYYREMRLRGVLLPPSQNEVMFLSTAHRCEDVDRTIEAANDSLGAIC